MLQPTQIPSLPLHKPIPQPNRIPNNDKHNNRKRQYRKHIARNPAATTGARIIQKRIHIKVLAGHGDVGKADVEREHDKQIQQVDPWQGRGAREDELEEGEDGVEGVLRDVGVDVEGVAEEVED